MCSIYEEPKICPETHTKRPKKLLLKLTHFVKLGQDPAVKANLKLRLLMLCEAAIAWHRKIWVWRGPQTFQT
jgi:hypothetical protein